MSWRKFDNRKDETKDVKKFLAGCGYKKAKVGHGRGTAWGWLHVDLGPLPRPASCTCASEPDAFGRRRCSACREAWSGTYDELGAALMSFTGRSGDYDGRIQLTFDLQ